MSRVLRRVLRRVLHHFSPWLECLLEEAAERVVMGVSHRERKEEMEGCRWNVCWRRWWWSTMLNQASYDWRRWWSAMLNQASYDGL
jgi:hypothetical protein